MMAGPSKARRRISSRIPIVTAIAGLALGFGVGPAFADPGNGNGNPNPPGHSDPPGNGNGAAAAHAAHGTGGTFGNPNSPQPLQHPDNQGHGANTFPGPYSSTRDGSPSLNGNGNGQAVGKPCAGCVGKADNKNPPGQFPDGSDANAGYECDRNSGIGKTNPAHTGCAAVPEAPPVPEVPPVEVTPPAQVTPPAPPRPPAQLVTISLPVSIPSVGIPTRALPVTGSQLLLQVLLALAALVVGATMFAVGRMRLRRA
jgi:hypothetical protein